jgi:drug/metabolite transporter (DMT)-like permease
MAFRLGKRDTSALLHGGRGLIVAVLYGFSTVFFVVAVFNASTANVAFLLAFNPMFAALLSWLFLGHHPSLATFLTMAAMALGVLIIVGDGLQTGHLFGDAMATLAALAIAGALTYSRASGLDFSFTPLVAAVIPAAAGAVMGAHAGYHIENPGWVLLGGLFLTPFSLWALAVGPKYLSAAETGMFYLLETVLAPVWVWMIFAEEPPRATLTGGAIILAALAAHSAHGLRSGEARASSH